MNNDEFASFVADEGPAIEQLRRLVGGNAGKHLDGSSDSLGILDTFVANLIATPEWERSDLFLGLGDMRLWLGVRVAYYMGLYARRELGCEWYLSWDSESDAYGTPVLAIDGIEFSPLLVSAALLNGGVHAGLVGFFTDLEIERRKVSPSNERRRRTTGCN